MSSPEAKGGRPYGQYPEMQDPPLQAFPHAPQWELLVLVSTQTLEQAVNPCAQATHPTA